MEVFDMPSFGVFWRWMGRPASETRCLSGLGMYIVRIEFLKRHIWIRAGDLRLERSDELGIPGLGGT